MKKSILILLFNTSLLFATTELKYESMMSDFNGVASSDSSIICYGTNGVLLRSSDLGATWDQIQIAHDTVTILKIINFKGEYWGITDNSNIVYSSAQGKYWSLTRTSRKFYDIQFYNDKMYLLSDNSIICYDNFGNELDITSFNLKIKPKEFGIINDYFILSADTGAIFIQNIIDKTDTAFIDFKISGLCTNCNIPTNFQFSSSAVLISTGDNILQSTTNTKKWVKIAKNGGLFKIHNNVIYNISQNVYYPQYLLSSPMLSKFDNGNYINITTEIERRYFISQQFADYKFINDSVIILAGANKTIFRSSNKGESWELISNKRSTYLTSWYDRNFGVTYKENGLVFTTRNGGITWKPQKFTDTTIHRFKSGNYAFAGSNGQCLISYPSGNVINKNNILFSKDYGETFVQILDDSLRTNWSTVDEYIDKDKNVLIYYSYDDPEYYQGSQLFILDNNLSFVKSVKMFDSLVLFPRTLQKRNGYLESFAAYRYPSKNIIIDSCEFYLIKSNDGENWTKEHICRIYGNIKTAFRINDNDFLLNVRRDTVIIDTVTHYGFMIGDFFLMNYHTNTNSYDTLLLSHRNPFQKVLSCNGKVFIIGWKTVFSSDSTNLSKYSWDSITFNPYQSIFVLNQFDNVLYGGATLGTKTNNMKFFLPTMINDVENEITNKSELIYPNPVSDYLVLTNEIGASHELPLQPIEIFSALGLKVLDTEWQEKIDVSNLPSGVYFVRVGDKVVKFVKI